MPESRLLFPTGIGIGQKQIATIGMVLILCCVAVLLFQMHLNTSLSSNRLYSVQIRFSKI